VIRSVRAFFGGLSIEHRIAVGFFTFLILWTAFMIWWGVTHPQPTEVQVRDAQIQECVALARYTVEQCIELTR